MDLADDILRAIKAAGYKVNETVRDAIDELIDCVEDENDIMDEDEDIVLEDEDGAPR